MIHVLADRLFGIGWTVGLKIAKNPRTGWRVVAIAVVFVTVSGTFMWRAENAIPIGTADLVWIGIGAAGMLSLVVRL